MCSSDLIAIRDEPLALDGAHRGEHTAIGHRLGAELAVDHRPAGKTGIGHEHLIGQQLLYDTNTVAVQALLIVGRLARQAGLAAIRRKGELTSGGPTRQSALRRA